MWLAYCRSKCYNAKVVQKVDVQAEAFLKEFITITNREQCQEGVTFPQKR